MVNLLIDDGNAVLVEDGAAILVEHASAVRLKVEHPRTWTPSTLSTSIGTKTRTPSKALKLFVKNGTMSFNMT